MLISRSQLRRSDQTISMMGYNFEIVENFKYLGAQINATHLFKSKILSKSCKTQLYKTTLRPILSYNAETWSLTQYDINNLKTFERKILRKIFGPRLNEYNEHEIRSNQELMNLIKNEDIVRFIKSQRLRWLRHLNRMDESRAPKRIFEARPLFQRNIGRPRSRWKDDVAEDWRKMNITNWQQLTTDREGWRRIVNPARAHTGL
ncbi:uncharacterized protein LOC129608396 [Condylostylus longicornis]|uniref:uncharacterized protein LOC129608396 n=1 Tax=Condylostylus longicornis TaxID=2530218 RepID=UPI00244DEB01|nr:uncharacterized protein LOC129608396 [Condylostylus longicornis]